MTKAYFVDPQGEKQYLRPQVVRDIEVSAHDKSALELAVFAAEAAIEAAFHITSKRNELGDLREYSQAKSSAVDPVTIVDSLAEDVISERIAHSRPRDGIIAEEGTFESSLSGVTWVVDPIDGTVNFIYGNPNYAVSIGAAVDGHVVAGAVINVATGDLFVAAQGSGAYKICRGAEPVELRANEETDLAKALVATGFSYSASRRKQQAEILIEVLSATRDIRRMGSAALDLCALAEGMVDCYYEHGLNSWDFAAGRIIAEEAGAVVGAPALSVSGNEGQIIWGAAPGLEREFSQLIANFPAALGR